MDKFNRVLDLMDEIIELEIEMEHVFDVTKAELNALRAVAVAAQAVRVGAKEHFPNMCYIAEELDALSDALDVLDELMKGGDTQWISQSEVSE